MNFPSHYSKALRESIAIRASIFWLRSLKVGDTVLVGDLCDQGRAEHKLEARGKGLGRVFKVDGKWFDQFGHRKSERLSLFSPEADLQKAVDRIIRNDRISQFFSSFSWKSRLTPEEFEKLCDLIAPALERTP